MNTNELTEFSPNATIIPTTAVKPKQGWTYRVEFNSETTGWTTYMNYRGFRRSSARVAKTELKKGLPSQTFRIVREQDGKVIR